MDIWCETWGHGSDS